MSTVDDIKGLRVMADPDMTLGEWIQFIGEMAATYGEDAYMYIDAGHNNSQLRVSHHPPNLGTGRPI